MAEATLHGIPVPEWLQQLRRGDPVEVTIRGTVADVIADCANGPEHLVMFVEYGSPHLHPPGSPLAIVVPAEAGVTIKSFVLAPAAT